MLKKQILWAVIGLCLILSNRVVAWQRTYGGDISDEGKHVELTADGGYIIAGWTKSYGQGRSDFYLIKTDAGGGVEWEQTFGTEHEDRSTCVQQTSDGGYILLGNTDPSDFGMWDTWLIKTDENGDSVWSQTLGESKSDCGNFVRQTSDGGYIIVGNTSSAGAGMSDIWLIKTDSEGEIELERTYGGPMADYGYCIRETSDGNFVVMSYSGTWGEGWVLKLDGQTLDTLWTSITQDPAVCIREAANGGYVTAGFGRFTIIEKLDRSGSFLWKLSGRSLFGNCDMYSVCQASDSSYVLTGYVEVEDNVPHQNLLVCEIIEDTSLIGVPWVLPADTVWSRKLGGENIDIGYCIQRTPDGGFVITGTTASFGAGAKDVWLIRLDSNGNDVEAIEEKPGEPDADWQLVNSIGSEIVLRYSDQPGGFHASVFDATGRKVDEIHSEGQSGTITWGECYGCYGCCGSGVYFIRASSGDYSKTLKVILLY